MKLLLDTHALIWFVENDRRLPQRARQALEDETNDLCCSVASLWEMAIKLSLRKLRMRPALDPGFHRQLEDTGFIVMPVEYAHAARVQSLPWHHRDPFDRLLLAQAMIEGLVLVSHDQQFDAYGIRRIW